MERAESLSATSRGPMRILVHALVHATEDEEKVKIAVNNLFPEEVRPAIEFQRTNLRGHHHNPIIRLEAQLTNPTLVIQTLKALGNRFHEDERQELTNTFDSRIDQKGQLFLRFDKQDSYQGHLHLVNRGDALRLVIRFARQKLNLGDLQNQCREFNLL